MSAENKKTLREKLMLDHEALHRQPIAWAAVLIPCLIAAVFFKFTDYGTLNLFSAEAQLNFISKAKLPLIIMGLGTVFLTIVVNAHRTIQTSKQIKVTEEKNKGDYFLNHYKMCLENVSHINANIQCTVASVSGSDPFSEQDLKILLEHKKLNVLYSLFYPKNNLSKGVVETIPVSFDNLIQSKIVENMIDRIPSTKANAIVANIELMATADNGKCLGAKGNDFKELIYQRKKLLEEAFPKFHEEVDLFTVTTENMLYSIDTLLNEFFVYVSINLGSDLTSNRLSTGLGFIDKTHYINSFNMSTVICDILTHFVDLQVAMGQLKSDSKLKSYISIYKSYLSQISS